jgi:hypothetical protein
MAKPIRLGAFLLGLICAGLGCYGSWEFALKLELGTVTYLVLAAPVIAAAAAMIPPIAEATWRGGQYLKSLLWWLVLVPAGAVVFFSAAERVHVAKAGAQAERDAHRGVATRAQAALTKAEGQLDKARADANRARGQKQCGPDCRTKLAAEASAQADVVAARSALLSAESAATTDSPLQAPVWLLPAALDLVAFMAMWTALSGGRSKPATVRKATPGERRSNQPRLTKAERAKAEAEALFRARPTAAMSSASLPREGETAGHREVSRPSTGDARADEPTGPNYLSDASRAILPIPTCGPPIRHDSRTLAVRRSASEGRSSCSRSSEVRSSRSSAVRSHSHSHSRSPTRRHCWTRIAPASRRPRR